MKNSSSSNDGDDDDDVDNDDDSNDGSQLIVDEGMSAGFRQKGIR